MQEEGVMTPQPTTLLQLRAREVLDIRNGKGLAVRCVAGALWITQDGDTEDIILTAGQCFTLDRPGLALVSAPTAPATALIEVATRDAPCATSRPSATDGLRRAA
jgi:hypothetical protein